jgi:hypothetical protein
MNYNPVRKKVFINAKFSDGLHEKELDNGSKLFLVTEKNNNGFETRYSEVIAVSPDITHIKKGDWIYHHQFATQPENKVAENIYSLSLSMIYGTKDEMFDDNVFLAPVKKIREVPIGGVTNAGIEKVEMINKCQADVIRGKYQGKRMYCSDISFHNLGGFGDAFFRTVEDQLYCDLDFNPCENITLIKRDEEDYSENESGIVLKRSSNRLKSQLKFGTIFRSNVYPEGNRCLFAPYKSILTEDGVMYDVLRSVGYLLENDCKLKFL